MGTTVTPNLGLIKPDVTGEPASNWPAQVAANYNTLDALFGADIPTNVPFYDEGTFTPLLNATITPPGLGTNPVQEGYFVRIGLLIQFKYFLQFGTNSDRGSGSYLGLFPFTADTTVHASSFKHALGAGYITDVDVVANRRVVTIFYETSTSFSMAPSEGSFVTHNTPFLWVDGDFLRAEGSYLADPALSVPSL